jgi:hypothetical protein
MATTAKGIMIITRPSDQYQASFESATCLVELSGDNAGLGVIDFLEDNVFEDTVT